MEEKASILIVDDNISLCKTMSFVLGRKSYAVSTAKNGMDGVETYRRIKEIRPEAVVMMMTAYAVEDLVQQALEEGVFGIVYKPLDIEKVVAVIEEAEKVKEGALILVVDDDPGTCIILRGCCKVM